MTSLFPEKKAGILIIASKSRHSAQIHEFLKELNYTANIFYDMEQGVQAAHDEAPDIIFIEPVFPEIDGFETCKRLRDNPVTWRIPVLFMIPPEDIDNKLKALEIGVSDYITKPFIADELLMRINLHLAIRDRERERGGTSPVKETSILPPAADIRRMIQEISGNIQYLMESMDDMDQSQIRETLSRIHARTKKNLEMYS